MSGLSTGTSLHALAIAAGIVPRWVDVHNRWHDVADHTLRLILAAMRLPAGSDTEMAESQALLAEQARRLPPMVTATVGQPSHIALAGRFTVTFEDGTAYDGDARDGILPPIDIPGYHRLDIAGQHTTLAVAPRRGFTVQDAAPGHRPFALAVQLYALRRPGDGGLGDFGALQDLIPAAARLGAAGIAISPVHAQFSADPDRFSPYSPSSRIQLNVLHAPVPLPPEAEALEQHALVDWPAAARYRLAALRAAYQAATPHVLASLAAYRAEQGDALQNHAVFEALHAREFAAGRWHWRGWDPTLQDPASPAVLAFAAEHADEVGLHAFMQFMADTSLAETQRVARDNGMSIGLIADLAVGADSGGSHCWSRQAEILPGMSVGAPPDLLSTQGQNWGLAAFSPTGLRQNGYRAFLEMLRNAMRHAGGVRIDHALGLARLWVVPDGLPSADGAYIAFPTTDLLRLIALESARARAIVLGEDLGTIPEGFQDRLAEAGTLGMRVLWFEKLHGLFLDPRAWTKPATAMTSTHDLATVAGWWTGRDLEWRSRLGLAGGPDRDAAEQAERTTDRAALWAAFNYSGAATDPMPATNDPEPVVDAAARHMATAACDLVILPIEDALGLHEQPNLPGTMAEHPNWRRRLDGPAANLLDDPRVAQRLHSLNKAHDPA
jgi:4-alpha-glucanotransferase